MKVEDFTKKDLIFAKENLRILSGLYGILRPCDLIKPHRLEMGTRLQNNRGKNLYDFWGNSIASGNFFCYPRSLCFDANHTHGSF